MKKFTKYVVEKKEEKILIENLGNSKELLVEFLSSGQKSLNDFIDNKMVVYKNQPHLKDNMKNEFRSYFDELSNSLSTGINITNESYNMEEEEYDDFAEEHAKFVISDYIDNKLKGGTLQSSFIKMVRDKDLVAVIDEDGEVDAGPQEMTIQALEDFADDIINQVRNLEIVEPMSKQEELEANRKPIGDNPGVM